MSIDKVRERISELTADLHTVEMSAEFRSALGWPSDGARAHLLAQARVELAVYTGAMKSVVALCKQAVDSGDHALAREASIVMTAMEDSLALAKATLDELQREDTDGV